MDVELRKGSVSKGEGFGEGIVPGSPGAEGWRIFVECLFGALNTEVLC